MAGTALISLAMAAPDAIPLPLPRPRPADMPKGQPPPPPPRQEPLPTAGEPKPGGGPDQACIDRLTAAGMQFEVAAPPTAANAACIIDTPVRLKSVKTGSRSQTTIRLPDEPVLACRFVEHLAHWLGIWLVR